MKSIIADSPESIRLILVDKDRLYREAIEAELHDEGFAVHSFGDSPSMLAAVAQGLRADVVIVDWGLDYAGELEVLDQLEAQGLDWPVVFLADRSSPTFEMLALRRGAADFLDKGRGTTVLAARLRRIVAQNRNVPRLAASKDVIQCGRLALRPGVSRTYWDGIDVNLTMAEFKVVQLLVSNSGSFVTYRQIHDCVHYKGFVAGSGEDGYRTNVRSAIRRIRNKFKMLSDEFNEIRTYNSFGYCWGNGASIEVNLSRRPMASNIAEDHSNNRNAGCQVNGTLSSVGPIAHAIDNGAMAKPA